jgi:glycosyltransferase involved in cell wall biosynthesis
MKLSIVITTYNRAHQIEELLKCVSRQALELFEEEKRNIEVLVVDNNSTDDSKQSIYKVIEQTTISIRYIFEERQGISHARNTAIELAKGDLIAFIHDDLSLDDDWLKESFKIAEHCKEHEIGVYGGRSIPLWSGEIPQCISLDKPYDVKQEVFTAHSYGDEEKFYPLKSEFGSCEFPLGVNFYIRREVFKNCGNFRTDLGRSAKGGFDLNEDYEFFHYLSGINVPMIYVPQSIVYHPIQVEQFDEKKVRLWYYKLGKCQYWLSQTDRLKRAPADFVGFNKHPNPYLYPSFSKYKIFGVPAYLYLKIIYRLMLLVYLRLSFSNKSRRAWLGYQIALALGEVDAAKLIYKRKPKQDFSFSSRIASKQPASI